MKWRLSPGHPWRDDQPTAFQRGAPGFQTAAHLAAVPDSSVGSAVTCIWCSEPGATCWPEWLGPAHGKCADAAEGRTRGHTVACNQVVVGRLAVGDTIETMQGPRPMSEAALKHLATVQERRARVRREADSDAQS